MVVVLLTSSPDIHSESNHQIEYITYQLEGKDIFDHSMQTKGLLTVTPWIKGPILPEEIFLFNPEVTAIFFIYFILSYLILFIIYLFLFYYYYFYYFIFIFLFFFFFWGGGMFLGFFFNNSVIIMPAPVKLYPDVSIPFATTHSK